MSNICIILPALLLESGQWQRKRLVTRYGTGTFSVQPFVGIMPAHGEQLFPAVGLGFIWCDSNNRHNQEIFPFTADPTVNPPISVMRLLRSCHVLRQIELIDLLHRQPNTLGDCWGISGLHVSSERRNILKSRFGNETFSLLIRSVEQYRPEEHEEERSILRENLQLYGVPFVEEE